MTNVVNLAGEPVRAPGEPNPALIRAIEQMLEEARSGTLQSFIGTGFLADGDRMSIWCDSHDNVWEMAGALYWLQHEYAKRHDCDDD